MIPGAGAFDNPWDDPAFRTSSSQAAPAPAADGAPAPSPAGAEPGIIDGPPPDPVAKADDYRIGVHDLLEITVFQAEELSRKVRVNTRGQLSMPLIGAVQAAGLTARELEEQLQALYGKDFLQDPHVSVFIEEFTSQRVTLEGWVKKPGIYPIKGRTTLMQAIALGEGIDELADTDDVVLFRDQAGQTVAYRLSLDEIRDGRVRDPVVVGDDRVFVGKASGRAFFKGITDALRGFIRPF